MKRKNDYTPPEERQRIRVVYEDDVKLLIQKLGLVEEIEQARIVCPFCSQTIDYDNIGTIYKKNGVLTICCDRFPCQFQAKIELDK